MDWMYWTWPTAVFFSLIGSTLIVMALWEWYSPSLTRRGFLPVSTTRGDRLFIILLSAAFINIAWLATLDLSQWYALGVSALWGLLVSLKG